MQLARCECGLLRALGELKFWQKFLLKPCPKCGAPMSGRMLCCGRVWRTL
jgi:hypothetical protein